MTTATLPPGPGEVEQLFTAGPDLVENLEARA
jgi:hypothetical protein